MTEQSKTDKTNSTATTNTAKTFPTRWGWIHWSIYIIKLCHESHLMIDPLTLNPFYFIGLSVVKLQL